MSITQIKAGGVLGPGTISESLPGQVAVGDTIVAAWTASTTIGGGTPVQDNLGTHYDLVDSVDDTVAVGESLYCYAGVVQTAGVPTVQANLNGAGTPADGAMLLASASGRRLINPIGSKHANATQPTPGTNGTISCGPVTSGAKDDRLMMMFDVGAVRTNNYSQQSPFTELGESGNGSTILDAMIQKNENVSAGSASGTALTTNNDRTVSFLVSLSPTVLAPKPFSTNFPATENPISQGGIWFNGGDDGLDWNNVRTTTGKCFGTNGTGFNDDGALLAGVWGDHQAARATVFKLSSFPGEKWELELRLRCTMRSNYFGGYEVAFSLEGGASSYVLIVRWNGPVNQFTYIFNQTGSQYEVLDGDIVGAEVNGNILSATRTRAGVTTVLASVDIADSGIAANAFGPNVFTGGSPGVGFDVDPGFTGHKDQFGFTTFDATDFTVPPSVDYTRFPKPPQRLRAQGLL